MQFRSKFEPLASDATAKAVLLAGFILSFIVLLVSLEDIGRYAGIDFRNRIVGARVLLTGQDPYTFEWQPGMPVELLDPCHDARVHRLTAPPPTLFLYAAIAELPYKVERLISCLLEWAAFIVCAFVLTRTIAAGQQRFLFLAATTVFFVLSFFWRAHLERGQVYVFHLLLLTGACALCLRSNLNSWSGGILFGLVALMRLNYLLAIPAFLVLRQWKTGTGAVLTFLLGVLFTLPFMHPHAWQSYLKVGDQYYLTLWAPETLPARPPPAHEGPVEGVDFTAALHDVTTTSFAAFYQMWQKKGTLPVVDLGLVSKGVLLALGSTLFALLLVGAKVPAPRPALALIICFVLFTDFFLPHRWVYVDVMLLLPLGLLWPMLCEKETASEIALIFVLVGFIGGICLVSQLSAFYANLLRSWLVMTGLTGLAIAWWLRSAKETRVVEVG